MTDSDGVVTVTHCAASIVVHTVHVVYVRSVQSSPLTWVGLLGFFGRESSDSFLDGAFLVRRVSPHSNRKKAPGITRVLARLHASQPASNVARRARYGSWQSTHRGNGFPTSRAG
jgi:hypothetical protein